MKYIFLFVFTFINFLSFSQPVKIYSVANAHSHNDYQNQFPFKQAYDAGFGSIEADVFLQDNKLYLAHDPSELKKNRSIEKEYLIPLNDVLKKNNGFPYADKEKELQILVDLKTNAVNTLTALMKLMDKYPLLKQSPQLKWVISGNKPDVSLWKNYPAYILFDANPALEYTEEQLSKIGLFSASVKDYTSWNGKSNLPAGDIIKIKEVVQKANTLNKKTRFWATPDFVNAWYQLMNLNIDFINTDKIAELQTFLNDIPKNTFYNNDFYTLYQPQYRNDKSNKKVKNVILFIGDGCGLAQLYAGFTANKGRLNIFNMKGSGISKTDSYDSYITDSAPGSNAISTGHKTCNRFVGVDHTGTALKLLPEYLHENKIVSGLITTGNVTDATPADFYGHNINRDDATGMFYNFINSPVKLLMGSRDDAFNEEMKNKFLNAGIQSTDNVINVNDAEKRWLVMQQQARHSVLNGRKEWMREAFSKSLEILTKNDNGFFIMVEAAQIDYGGHSMDLPYVATEVMDMDKTVGEAMKFADSNGETLVLVVADHETGGLTLLDGNIEKGYVAGNFSTNDHTAIPISVFAYGPQSHEFNGFYENTEIFKKILEAFGIVTQNK